MVRCLSNLPPRLLGFLHLLLRAADVPKADPVDKVQDEERANKPDVQRRTEPFVVLAPVVVAQYILRNQSNGPEKSAEPSKKVSF